MSDLLEVLADVWQWLGLLDQGLVVVDQCQSYTEQDFRALVEQAIPNPQDCLQGNKGVNPTSEHTPSDAQSEVVTSKSHQIV